MRGAAERGHVVIGLGDFNMVPLSLAHRLIESQAPVRDVWRAVYPESSLGAALDMAELVRALPTPDVKFNLAINGTTCDSAYNTWRWDKKRQKRLDKGDLIQVDIGTTDPHAKRLDYIFFGPGTSPTSNGRYWSVDTVSVGVTERHSTLHCSLSDHFSVEASFSCRNIPDGAASAVHRGPQFLGSGETVRDISSTLQGAVFDEILAMIQKYKEREVRQRRLRLGHFGASLTVSILCLVGVWWSPHNGVAFMLTLISSLGLTAGVIDGLIGGLFVSSELRAMKEFEWEIRNAKDLAFQDS